MMITVSCLGVQCDLNINFLNVYTLERGSAEKLMLPIIMNAFCTFFSSISVSLHFCKINGLFRDNGKKSNSSRVKRCFQGL